MVEWGSILALLISIAIAFLLFHLLKKILPLILNGIFGLVVFWLLSNFGWIAVPISWVTFLIAAIGGVFGVIIVVVLSFLGVPL